MKQAHDERKHRAGRFLRQPGGFPAFVPHPLPPDPPLIVSEELQSVLGEAERNLGRLDSVSTLIPDPDRFVYMYVRNEAVLSSQIEGTQASLSDLLSFEAAENKAERTGDLSEVLNYLEALNKGLKLLHTLPISTRLLCQVHRVLTQDVRGGESSKTPGELRRSQNWIGGNSPAIAVFVPPPPVEMQAAMGGLEKFLNDSTKRTPLLFEIGLAHAQFETIHPFLDGNGRVGRLLITFLLHARGVLSRPLLYVSYYLKKNQTEYYDRLQAIRTAGDWEGWLLFFVRGVVEVASEATDRARKILALQEADRKLIQARMGQRATSALALLDHLMSRPITTSRLAAASLGRTQPTVDRLLKDLVRLRVLRETTGQMWGKRFAYQRYLAMFQV